MSGFAFFFVVSFPVVHVLRHFSWHRRDVMRVKCGPRVWQLCRLNRTEHIATFRILFREVLTRTTDTSGALTIIVKAGPGHRDEEEEEAIELLWPNSGAARHSETTKCTSPRLALSEEECANCVTRSFGWWCKHIHSLIFWQVRKL